MQCSDHKRNKNICLINFVKQIMSHVSVGIRWREHPLLLNSRAFETKTYNFTMPTSWGLMIIQNTVESHHMRILLTRIEPYALDTPSQKLCVQRVRFVYESFFLTQARPCVFWIKIKPTSTIFICFYLVAITMLSVCLYLPLLTSECLNQFSWNLDGTWAHLNGVLHKSLPSVCVSVCVSPYRC
jgi:hypothetical protein